MRYPAGLLILFCGAIALGGDDGMLPNRVRQNHAELIAPVAGDQVTGAHSCPKGTSGGPEHAVSSLVAVLIVGLLILQVSGVMVFSAWLVALLGLLFWAIDAALLWFGRRGFRRSKLATQM